jgi:two-component system phosphate regulon sensor histidine kinase PhoR
MPYVVVTLQRHEIETLAGRLAAEARLAGDGLPWAGEDPLDAACRRMANDLDIRVTVIAPDGRVVGESTRSSESLENHADRPEVQQALASGLGQSVRHSVTVGVDLLYIAWRQSHGDEVRVVRVAMPLTAVAANVARLRWLILWGIAVAALMGLIMALVLSRRMIRRLHRLVDFARRVAGGEPPPYLTAEQHDELGLLENQLGDMARSVTATIRELRVERERLEAILRGMVEGVLVTDLEGGFVLMNRRARELLGVPANLDARGRSLAELSREPALGELVRELGAGAATLSRDMTLAGGTLALQANAARLRAADGEVFGYVLVLHDVTELRHLEVIRRDFVANVSHELRTPLTAIKGYAETLLGPAGDDRETARKFLAVIDRHSERLGRLIEDLLTLSDLELGRMPMRVGEVAVEMAVEDVLQILDEPAARAGVSLTASVAPDTPEILADPDRFRQVLINLVDNAIKYTQPGGRVIVRAASADGRRVPMVEVAIEDTGMGIPAQDLPRLTERFFRVDKARSRALGGTGLGLAIVKHIVQAHGGELSITSALGRGTTVRTFFPTAGPAPRPDAANTATAPRGRQV